MKELPVRKDMRLQGYDYSSAGYYFVTICTKNREFMLGDILNGEMCLNEYGEIALNELLDIHQHYENVQIDKYVFMPNHIHAIIVLVGAPLAALAKKEAGRASASPTLGNIVRGYKSGVSRKAGFLFWQRSYHDHIIRNEAEYQRIWQYIEENPARWTEDCYHVEQEIPT